MGSLRRVAIAVAWVAPLALAGPAATATPETRRPDAPSGDGQHDPFVWRTGNLAWLDPMIERAVRGEALAIDDGFFDEGLPRRSEMSPNHEAVWRALRYLAAVRGEGGELDRERLQVEAWLLRQRNEGLQLDEPGGYVQRWAAASAVAALAAWEDVHAHPKREEAVRTARAALGWWRDFGAYYGRLRTPRGLLLRVGARQSHHPRDAAFDEVLLDLVLGPPRGGPHVWAQAMARKPEREWLRRGIGAWAAREVMQRGVPLAEVARDGMGGPLPRIWNPVTIRPGEWAWMPRVAGRGPIRWASWIENGELRISGQPVGQRAQARSWQVGHLPRWDLATGDTTGPHAPLSPLPRVPQAAPAPDRATRGER